MKSHSSNDIRGFFASSDWLDRLALRPLRHIACNWEASWDEGNKRYQAEPFSFADDLNQVIGLIAAWPRPRKYHAHEDVLAERVIRELKWPIQKKGRLWVGADYQSILEQGAFSDLGQKDLIAAAAGRVHAGLDHGQKHFDDMEEGHFHMLAALITIIIYHRYNDGTSLLVEQDEENS